MKPGSYLTKRRDHAKLSIGEVARQLAVMQFGIVPFQSGAIQRQLLAAEAGDAPLEDGQLLLLRHVYPLDPEVYRQLVERDVAAPEIRPHLPLPAVCRECACSWNDPCHPATGTHSAFGTGTCWWVDGPEVSASAAGIEAEPLCSACAAASAPTAPPAASPVRELA